MNNLKRLKKKTFLHGLYNNHIGNHVTGKIVSMMRIFLRRAALYKVYKSVTYAAEIILKYFTSRQQFNKFLLLLTVDETELEFGREEIEPG